MPKDWEGSRQSVGPEQSGGEREAGLLHWLQMTVLGPHYADLDLRAQRFLDDMKKLKWSRERRMDSLEGAIGAIDSWAADQIRFYSSASRRAYVFSCALRCAAWTCATSGVLLPLLASTTWNAIEAQAGFVFLAAGGALYGYDKLIGFTSSHVRMTCAQISIEKLIIETHSRWCEIRIKAADAEELSDALFVRAVALIHTYGKTLYGTITDERSRWGDETLQNWQRFEQRLSSGRDAMPEHEITGGKKVAQQQTAS